MEFPSEQWRAVQKPALSVNDTVYTGAFSKGPGIVEINI